MSRYTILFLAAIVLLSGCQSTSTISVREALLKNAQAYKIVTDFTDEYKHRIVKFSYIGKASTKKGDIHIVDYQGVTTNMPSPRGHGKILFFDHNFKYIDSLNKMNWPRTSLCI